MPTALKQDRVDLTLILKETMQGHGGGLNANASSPA